MATIGKLKPGQVLYTLTRQPMGNTTVRTVAVHTVRVNEVHEDHVVASWNSNTERKYGATQVRSWRTSKPTMTRTFLGASRLATKEEIQAAKAAGKLHESSNQFYIQADIR